MGQEAFCKIIRYKDTGSKIKKKFIYFFSFSFAFLSQKIVLIQLFI